MKPALLLGALVLAASPAHALFKVVGPDGRVTYTDRPPNSADGKLQSVNRDGGGVSEAALPFALRQIVARFPVTLYTTSNCEPCGVARASLVRRGVPFSERIAEAQEDREAWTRLIGGPEAPALRVGGQVLRGFNPSTWDETLDLAGYPKQSLLPASWQPPTAVPLVDRKASAGPNLTPQSLPASPAPAQVDPRSNPAGIRF
ncbi:MAG: glutaredoxin family protein [Aquincola sp.]|nr:glutaredoxin family protein [Aquincola sp.]MDH4288292.1 glutaredoxin family protein [Aquincola sp.]MDH5330383.1 glutaredoxin family protein [Aquincola sp.]